MKEKRHMKDSDICKRKYDGENNEFGIEFKLDFSFFFPFWIGYGLKLSPICKIGFILNIFVFQIQI